MMLLLLSANDLAIIIIIVPSAMMTRRGRTNGWGLIAEHGHGRVQGKCGKSIHIYYYLTNLIDLTRRCVQDLSQWGKPSLLPFIKFIFPLFATSIHWFIEPKRSLRFVRPVP